jgi:hypothetical protein
MMIVTRSRWKQLLDVVKKGSTTLVSLSDLVLQVITRLVNHDNEIKKLQIEVKHLHERLNIADSYHNDLHLIVVDLVNQLEKDKESCSATNN